MSGSGHESIGVITTAPRAFGKLRLIDALGGSWPYSHGAAYACASVEMRLMRNQAGKTRYGKDVPVDSVTIDRFENELAVPELEAGVTLDIPRAWLPSEAREGDVLRVRVRSGAASGTSSSLRFVIDVEATEERREEALKRRDQIPKGPEGDIEL